MSDALVEVRGEHQVGRLGRGSGLGMVRVPTYGAVISG